MEIRGQDQPPDIELVLSSYFNLELRKKKLAGEGGGGGRNLDDIIRKNC